MLLNNFDFDKMDLMNYKNKERYMNAQVMMADKATQTLNKENKATQTDLPNDKATQTYNFDDETKILGGSSKSFKSKLVTKAEAEALAFTYDLIYMMTTMMIKMMMILINIERNYLF